MLIDVEAGGKVPDEADLLQPLGAEHIAALRGQDGSLLGDGPGLAAVLVSLGHLEEEEEARIDDKKPKGQPAEDGFDGGFGGVVAGFAGIHAREDNHKSLCLP